MNPLTHDTTDVRGSLQSWSRVLSCPLLFDEPDRIVDPMSWVEHIPFAFWLVDALKPRVLVELGTHSGNSYAAFAQAVQRLGLTTACYAVDTWKGDPQAGFYGDEVFAEWSAYHDRRFAAFSRLVRSTFAEALVHFEDSSIDLLHIDGYHSLEAVRGDFSQWLPKMSRQGVVLLHDVNVRERDFGAWRFWEEVRTQYPSFTFLHGHGLGVLAVGPDAPEPVAWLASHQPGDAETGRIRSFFARLGGGLLARHQAGVRERQLDERERQLDEEVKAGRRQLSDARETLRRQEEAHARDMTRVRSELSSRLRELEAEASKSQRMATEQQLVVDALRESVQGAEAEVSSLRFALASARLDQDEPTPPGAEDVRVSQPADSAWPARLRGWFRHALSVVPRRAELRALVHPPMGRRIRLGQVARLLKRPSLLTRIRDVNTVVQPGWYFSLNPDLVVKRVNPLAHFLLAGDRERRQPHPLFDPVYYLSQARVPDGISPFEHFLTIGWREGFNPHRLFDTRHYLRCAPDVVRQDVNPLVHYLRSGASERRHTHVLFDPWFYAESNPDVVAQGLDPLTHYLTEGFREGRNPHPLFDSAYYTAENPDVAGSGLNPLAHFAIYGWSERRSPSAGFDAAGYLADHPELFAQGINPLVHFLEHRHAPGGTDDASITKRVPLTVRALQPVRRERPVVVCVSHVMPWPPRAGNEYRIQRMLDHLRGKGYTIVPVIAPLPGVAVAEGAVRELAARYGNAVLCDRDGHLDYLLNDVPDVLAPMDGDLPARYSTILREAPRSEHERGLLKTDRVFCHDPLIWTVLRLHRALGRSVLLAEYIWMSRLLPLLHGDVLKIIDTIDVFSNKREKVVQHGVVDWVIEREDEAARLQKADLILAIQEEEAQLLKRMVPQHQVLTTGVDFNVVVAGDAPDTPTILFVGSDNLMNQKGLHDFLQFAWPRIREQVPDAQLLVAGAVGLTLAVSPDGVSCLGLVDDVDPLYARCRLVINPAVAGTGVKIKTIEALSRLRRVVTWPSGVEGLPREVAGLCVTARDWYEFSKHVIRLLRTGAEISPADRAAVEHFSAPDRVYQSLTEAIEQYWARP